MSDWITIPESLLAHAFQVMNPYPAPANSPGIDVPPSLLEGILEYLSGDLDCDHSVGICACGSRGLVQEITLALRGQSLCPRCGGDGCDWSAERYAEAVLDYQNAHECTLEQARSNVSDFDAMSACSVCDGSGAVHTSDLEAKKLEAKKLQESE
jgi:hypothetical protein